MAAGAASHACRRGSGSTRGFDFLFWGLFHMLGSGHSAPCRLRRDGTRRFWFGGLFHMLGSGQPRMPPRERQHEGLGGLGDCFTRSGAAARGILIALVFPEYWK